MKTPGERLKWARRNRTNFLTPTEAARAFGWKQSTYLGHENGDRIPSREAAKRYAAAYRVEWGWILEGGPEPRDPVVVRNTVPTVGEVAFGVWRDLASDVEDYAEYPQFPLTNDQRYPAAQYALVARSPVGPVADVGDGLHCVDLTEAGLEAEEGNIVIASRRRPPYEAIETTVWVLGSLKGKPTLFPLTGETKRLKPIELDENVEITAIVIGVYKPLTGNPKTAQSA